MGTFYSAVYDLYSAMDDVNGKWQYYRDGSWRDFTVGGQAGEICGDQLAFGKLGVGSIAFHIYSDWDEVQVADGTYNKTGFWIRYLVTSVGASPVSPYQWHRDIYTVSVPYIDIDADRVPGDMPALARLVIDAAACDNRTYDTIAMGLRSLSRGTDFTAYLNASDVPMSGFSAKFGIDTSSYNDQHLQDSIFAPTGRLLDLTGLHPVSHSNTDFFPVGAWHCSSSYIGTYHAFVRCNFPSAAVGTIKLRLKAELGDGYNVFYSDIGSILLWAQICTIDLGQLSILPASYSIGYGYEEIDVKLEVASTDDDAFTNAVVYDVILIPADEWSGNFGVPVSTGAYDGLTYSKSLDVDGVTTPRQYKAIQTRIDVSGKAPIRYATAEWTRIASSEPVFQANADQRLWFTMYHVGNDNTPYFESCGAIRAERSARYLLMRGNE